MRGREERGQAAVLREGENASFGKERERVVQGPQLPVWSEPAVMETPRAELC